MGLFYNTDLLMVNNLLWGFFNMNFVKILNAYSIWKIKRNSKGKKI